MHSAPDKSNVTSVSSFSSPTSDQQNLSADAQLLALAMAEQSDFQPLGNFAFSIEIPFPRLVIAAKELESRCDAVLGVFDAYNGVEIAPAAAFAAMKADASPAAIAQPLLMVEFPAAVVVAADAWWAFADVINGPMCNTGPLECIRKLPAFVAALEATAKVRDVLARMKELATGPAVETPAVSAPAGLPAELSASAAVETPPVTIRPHEADPDYRADIEAERSRLEQPTTSAGIDAAGGWTIQSTITWPGVGQRVVVPHEGRPFWEGSGEILTDDEIRRYVIASAPSAEELKKYLLQTS